MLEQLIIIHINSTSSTKFVSRTLEQINSTQNKEAIVPTEVGIAKLVCNICYSS